MTTRRNLFKLVAGGAAASVIPAKSAVPTPIERAVKLPHGVELRNIPMSIRPGHITYMHTGGEIGQKKFFHMFETKP